MTEFPSDIGPPPARHLADVQSDRAGFSTGVLAAGLVLAIAVAVLSTKVYRQNAAIGALQTKLGQSNSETAKTYVELDKAKVQSADLQARLLTVQGELSDQRARVERANARSADLQAQLERAAAQRDGAIARSTELQERLNRAGDELAGLRSERNRARHETDDLRAQLARAASEVARAQPAILESRRMPVETSLEKSFWDRGFTLHIKNLNTEPLKATIAIAGQGRPLSKEATIDGGSMVDVGNLLAGDSIAIKGAGYDTVNLTVQ